MTDLEKAARTALKGLAASGDFLFNWHDCDPDNPAEMQAYATALAAITKAVIALEEALNALAWQRAGELNAQEDPCPGCRKGGVCRTPACGRLKLPVDHPYRTGIYRTGIKS